MQFIKELLVPAFTMGQWISMQTLVQIALGRPYIDVFGDEDDDEKTESNSSDTAKIIKVERRHVRVLRFSEDCA